MNADDSRTKKSTKWFLLGFLFILIVPYFIFFLLRVAGIIFLPSDQDIEKIFSETSAKSIEKTLIESISGEELRDAKNEDKNEVESSVAQSKNDANLEFTQKFKDEELGISFDYNNINGRYSIRRQNNKVVIISNYGDNVETMLEVFSKATENQFADAIKEKFIPTEKIEECLVITKKTEIGLQGYIKPKSEIRAEISGKLKDDGVPLSWGYCGDYSETNGAQFFLFREKNPNKFIFLRVGQSVPIFNIDSIEFIE